MLLDFTKKRAKFKALTWYLANWVPPNMARDNSWSHAFSSFQRPCLSVNEDVGLPGVPDVIRKEACPFYRTSSGVRLCWELEEPKGPKGRSVTSPHGLHKWSIFDFPISRGIGAVQVGFRLPT